MANLIVCCLSLKTKPDNVDRGNYKFQQDNLAGLQLTITFMIFSGFVN